ncbi:mannose-6-phosphate isomerase, class I [Treponema primitia]|uniref:mannose-6-phosphate isomerase, class I n=1 Tax=Treponema primitia TaxID=88058 RepID=UPI0002554FC0|nr:mannose-6-phosphate isomerase, class I [Treponema primitia]
MASVFKLKNPIKQYDWGSPEWIPQQLGLPNDTGEPWAELWMGVHPEGPSELALPTGSVSPAPRLLPELIGLDPARYLGEGIAGEFGALPFLYKLLAAARPLSIQAHPNLAQAKAGWERENSLGIPPKAPNRNYKDPNHKPEIICALTPFTAMAGFREPGEIIKRLKTLHVARETSLQVAPLISALEAPAREAALRGFLAALFSLPAETRQALGEYARRYGQDPVGEYAEEWKYAAWFAELYPGDPALIAPLYLNLINLKPGEAMNIPAGILHAYVQGFGIELMANSDNVLRGGLTPKHVDLKELTGILRFAPFNPEIIHSPGVGNSPGLYRYPSPCREFSLYRMSGCGGEAPFPLSGPVILIVLEGELIIPTEKLRLKQGESAFIAFGSQLVFSGNYTIYIAGTGTELLGSLPV